MRIIRAFPFALPLLGLLYAAALPAQTPELRGIVRDSASNEPVPGTVVVALDGIGATLGRTIANARGEYRLPMPTGALLLRAIRIGYRSATERIPLTPAATVAVDLVIAAVPLQLQTVEVAGARGCPVRADQSQASSLLEQARAALLATVVARERHPAQLVVLRYDRELDLDGIGIEEQRVSIDSSSAATTSFNAVRNAVDFVTSGFRTHANGQFTYFGPDADVLLDRRFERGYCFSIAKNDVKYPTHIGLHFSPADSKNGRVDVDGTLWLDTAARSLHEITYRYVGIEALAESFNAGGRVTFVTPPSGVPLIESWNMRMVGGAENSDGHVQMYAIRETGGALARAQWPDGETWRGPEGTIAMTLVHADGVAAGNTKLTLAGTSYAGITDNAGRVTFSHVLPGSYTVAVVNEAIAPLDMLIPSEKTVVVRRNATTIARVTVPTVVATFSRRCGGTMPSEESVWLVSRVFLSDGTPAAGVHWRASVESSGRWKVLRNNGITGPDGVIVACRSIALDSRVEIVTWRSPTDVQRVERTMKERFNVVRIDLPAAVSSEPPSASRDGLRDSAAPRERSEPSGAMTGATQFWHGSINLLSTTITDYANPSAVSAGRAGGLCLLGWCGRPGSQTVDADDQQQWPGIADDQYAEQYRRRKNAVPGR